MRITKRIALVPAVALLTLLGACGGNNNDNASNDPHMHDDESTHSHDNGHTHDDGHSHDNGHDHDNGEGDAHDHDHEEQPLGTFTIGGMQIELAQAHGEVEPGKESHLVVKLPYSDNGATLVRAWIGTEDRTRSYVGKGEYAPAHDDFDIHATAPDPLPENAKWWIEIEKPDGTTVVGSAPLLANVSDA